MSDDDTFQSGVDRSRMNQPWPSGGAALDGYAAETARRQMQEAELVRQQEAFRQSFLTPAPEPVSFTPPAAGGGGGGGGGGGSDAGSVTAFSFGTSTIESGPVENPFTPFGRKVVGAIVAVLLFGVTLAAQSPPARLIALLVDAWIASGAILAVAAARLLGRREIHAFHGIVAAGIALTAFVIIVGVGSTISLPAISSANPLPFIADLVNGRAPPRTTAIALAIVIAGFLAGAFVVQRILSSETPKRISFASGVLGMALVLVLYPGAFVALGEAVSRIPEAWVNEGLALLRRLTS